jgi:hypothetical protein
VGVWTNADGSKTLRRGTRSTTLATAEFATTETDRETESRLATERKSVLDCEVAIQILSRSPLKTVIRLAPNGTVEWLDLKIDSPPVTKVR